jgi:hypothetical protein
LATARLETAQFGNCNVLQDFRLTGIVVVVGRRRFDPAETGLAVCRYVA